MIFNLILLVLLGTIAFFHYTQGFFSAALSAIITVIAAVMAVSYHESLAAFLVPKAPDWAVAVSLVGLFAAIYVLLRIIFDKMVPGNIRFPLLVDKIGAGVLGFFAGLFATGILALAGESMAFGPSVAGYARAELRDRADVVISKGVNTGVDTAIADEMVGDTVDDPDHMNHLWFHQDELVTGLVAQLSSNGPLASGNPLSMAHPDYPTELFANRLGVQIGAVHAVPEDKPGGLNVKDDWFEMAPFGRFDPVLPEIRPKGYKLPDLGIGSGSKWFLNIPVDVDNSPNLADADGLIRFSLANVRLVAGGQDFYPIGTMGEDGGMAQNRQDDPLIVDTKTAQPVIFVFLIDPVAVFGNTATDKKQGPQFVDGAFVEMKRFARYDLSGKALVRQGKALLDLKINPNNTLGDKSYGGILRPLYVLQNARQWATPIPGAKKVQQ